LQTISFCLFDFYFTKVANLGYIIFMGTRQNPSFLSIMSSQELEYAFLASQGYSNREVAKAMNVSERVASGRFGKIYEKLGVKNKSELVRLIVGTHTGRHFLLPR